MDKAHTNKNKRPTGQQLKIPLKCDLELLNYTDTVCISTKKNLERQIKVLPMMPAVQLGHSSQRHTETSSSSLNILKRREWARKRTISQDLQKNFNSGINETLPW